MPPDTGETDAVLPGAFGRAMWTGVSFNLTTPSGVTTNIPVPSGQQDSIGGGYFIYSPTEVGTYHVKAIFPEQWKNSTLILSPNGNGTYISTRLQRNYPNPNSEFYSAATSEDVTFTVQQDPISLWPISPVPTDYWTRPINDAARNWGFELGGNWLNGAWNNLAGQAGGTTTRFVYGLGTETSHILWTRSLYAGGYTEARFDDYGYQTGHYQGMDFNSIILNGRVYYADRADAYRSIGFNVVDLNTGELLGYFNDTMPSYGQLYKYESPNQHGIYPLLWRAGPSLGAANGTVLEMLDGYALPLRRICLIANSSATGTNVVGNNGDLLWYNLVNYGTATNPNYRLTCWNNTNVLGETATGPNTGTTYWQWRPEGGGFGGGPALSNAYVWNGATGFSVNASIATPYNARNAILNQTGTIRTVRVGDTNGVGGFVIVGTQGQNNEQGNVQGQLWCYSLERGKEGTQLWTTTFSAPYASVAQNDTTLSLTGVYPEDGIILFHSTKQLKYWGYDMTTGALLWETPREPDQNYYSTQVNYYKGLLLTTGYGGVCIAYNMTTGQQAWNFTAANVGGESPYGNYPINIFAICDDKIYTLTGEHSVTQPLYRGPNIRCISAADGSEIWSLLGMGADNGAHLTGQFMQFGDGKVVGLNYFDNQIYCIGPGTSATTVSAPQTVPVLGSSVTITGTVTDQTKSGRRNMNNLYDFTLEGTPAISDDSMDAWMEYLYQNQAKPTNAFGVDVSLSAIDPNGNIVTIGTTTSDVNGNYGVVFKPEVPGTYQILASFAGSKAYGASQSSTYLTVGDGPTVTPGPTATPDSVADMYLIPATVGIIVAIAIATIVIVLALRKRP
jgi:hypothetical protein